MEQIDARIIVKTGIKSSHAAPYVFPDVRITYPKAVIKALEALYRECNRAFQPLIAANREWETDYRYCLSGNTPINWVVQIDMVGLTEQFLKEAVSREEKDIQDILRFRIFEIENSWAMYQLLNRACEKDGQESSFSKGTRAILDGLRRRFGMPVALLAVTQAKLEAMRATEFGKSDGEFLSDSEVSELSGFDRLFGPDDFRKHIAENDGKCGYLLYVRASDPVEKLKRPQTKVEHPLLADPEMRRVIKAHALTLNIDNPDWPTGDPRRINDTKLYMPAMGMAFSIDTEMDFFSFGLRTHLAEKKPYPEFNGTRLSGKLAEYLRSVGIDPEIVENSQQVLRAKPAQGTYGCYGHERGTLSNSDFRRRVRRGTQERGPYLVQPEHKCPVVLNIADRLEYAFIDRVFFGMTDDVPRWLGGFREFLPSDSHEAKAGRLHGNIEAVFAEVSD